MALQPSSSERGGVWVQVPVQVVACLLQKEREESKGERPREGRIEVTW